ncbi:MAG: hypothetical protein HY360_13600 [Verrucomicrobia bacterium]|nr:hypothetical protein [Verrucomicrobiota bacterium]
MSRILRVSKSPTDADGSSPFGAVVLEVCGETFSNSAARFWSHLMDEVAHDFPDCAGAILRAPAQALLDRELLCPERALEAALADLIKSDLKQSWEETLMQIRISGEPYPVQIEILAAETVLSSKQVFTPDCLDSEIFSFLVVWLLKWAEVPESAWNDERVEGRFHAVDPRRKIAYVVRFLLRNVHLHEGLYERSLRLEFCLGAV